MKLQHKDLTRMFNSVRSVNGINIAYVAWKNKPWLIIENEETFEDAKQDTFIPILDFGTRSELIKHINNSKFN